MDVRSDCSPQASLGVRQVSCRLAFLQSWRGEGEDHLFHSELVKAVAGATRTPRRFALQCLGCPGPALGYQKEEG